jgi:hypothetical protein
VRLVAKTRARRAARATYWALDRDAHRLHRQIADAADPAIRAILLAKIAAVELRMADLHDDVFGPDLFEPDNVEDEALDALGLYVRDPAGSLAQSMRLSAMMYRLLGDVEQAVAYPHMGRRQPSSALVGVAADVILDRMAVTPDLGDRMAFLDDLYESVVDKVGGQAAETIACLPYPKTEKVR